MGWGYQGLRNFRIRDKGRKRSLFDKANEITEHIKAIIPEIEQDKLISMLSHCRRYYEGKLHYGRRGSSYATPGELTFNERLVYDYLLKSGLNPSTTYRWFLASRIPSDIKELIKTRQMSVRLAFSLSANRLRNRMSKEGLLMMEEIRQVIRKY